ncbi:DUF4262 domain-containing protein [Hellea sp.]|nr:DUF4262 domain-containing protein [Hellea sp.]
MNDYEVSLLEKVIEHGWHATHVFDPDGNDPLFSYSTGFTKTLGMPEFIIIGLSKDLMHNMLWQIFHQLKAGAVPKDGMRWQGLLEGFDCISKKADHPDLFKEYTVSANWFWKHQGRDGHPEVFQMVWPGAQQGLFPWEEGCDSYVISQQPPLWSES